MNPSCSFAVLITLTLLVTIPATAYSQATHVPTGSRVPQRIPTRALDPEDVGRVRDEFATCVYADNKSNAARLFAASDPGGIDYDAFGSPQRRFARVFSMSACLEEAQDITNSWLSLSTNADSFRLMMLEAAYLDRFPSPPAWLDDNIAIPERSFVSEGDDLGLAIAMAGFADCIVAAAPQEADAILRTPSKSPAETAAAGPLIPHLGPCLPDGQTLELQVENVRQFAAEGLWHLASAHEDTNAMEAAE